MTDKSTAAQTGSENPSSTDAGASRVVEKDAKNSVRSSVERALAAAGVAGEEDTGPPNETDKARAVLKGGAGADEDLAKADSEARERRARKAETDVDKDDRKPAEKAAKDKDAVGEKGKAKAGDKDEGKAKDKPKAKADDDQDDDDDDTDADDDDGDEDDGDDKPKRERGEDGKFKAGEKDKDGKPGGDDDTDDKVSEPPARMTEAAKKAWARAPKEIRGDVHRLVREYEGGLQKNKDAAENWSKLVDGFSPMMDKDGKPVTYAALSQQMKTTPKEALDRYVALDIQLGKDPIGTIDKMLRGRNLDFRKVAEAFLKIDPKDLERHTEEQKLRDENEQLKREKAHETGSRDQARRAQVDTEITKFYDAHPRLAADKEFEKVFGGLYTSGAAATLEEAFEMAERAKPRKGPKVENPDTAAQTRKSDLSESGGRTEASDATSRRERSKSVRGAAERAARNAGL